MEKLLDFLQRPWLYFVIIPALLFVALNIYSIVKYKKGKKKQSAKKEEVKTEPKKEEKKDDGKIAYEDFYSSILNEIDRQNNSASNSKHEEALKLLDSNSLEKIDEDFDTLLGANKKVDEFKIEEYNYDVCDIKSPEEISWDAVYDEKKPFVKRKKVISKKLKGLTKEQKILLMTNVLNDKKD